MNELQGGGPKTKALVFSDQSLFANSIEDLLRRDENLRILACETDPEQALESLEQIRPDVVILAGCHAASEFAPAVMAALKQGPAVRVVEVNLDSNMLLIYGKELRAVKEVKDLLEAILQSAAPRNGVPAGNPNSAG